MTALDKLIDAYDSATDDSKCADVTYFGRARLAIMENARKEQAELIAVAEQYQWSATAHGNYGSTARACPQCGGIREGDSLNDGGGRHTVGSGHKPDCVIAALLSRFPAK